MRIARTRGGQFMPLIAFVILTSVVFLVAAVNVYRVTKAKLLAQNIADAAALAIAATEAKEINVVVDRNEWMNHMYPDNAASNPHQMPNISQANGHKFDDENAAQQYAQLVASINQAQSMFMDAFSRFMGVDTQAPGGSGPGGLADILSEIDGLQDPSVQLFVYNTNEGQSQANDMAQAISQGQTANSGVGASQNIHPSPMAPVPFKPEDVTVDTGKGRKTLSKILNVTDPRMKVGWMHPDWTTNDPQSTLTVKTSPGQSKATIGAGAIVVKTVHLLLPFARDKAVTAKATAYVVQESGLSANPSDTSKAPPSFRPTFFVRLGYPQ